MLEGFELDKIASGWFNRTAKAASASAGIIGSLIGQGAKTLFASEERKGEVKANSQIAMALKLATQLGNLKGAIMKLGQMASYVDSVIPDEVREVLVSLQDSTPPMKYELVDQVIREELGSSPETLFENFEKNSFAAASIGQVHRATLSNGQQVAVKVQYPGIEQAFEADFKNATLMGQISKIILRGMNVDEVVDELRDRLVEECDYALEAKNQHDFALAFSADSDIVIPDIVASHSAKRVLTSEFMVGERFHTYVKTASQQERNRIGEIIFRKIMTSIFRYAMFNGDPHPGNYLIQNKQIVFLDFGCVKRWSPEFIEHWKLLVRSGYENSLDDFSEHFTALGFVKNKERFNYEKQFELNKHIWSPFIYNRKFKFTREFTRGLSDLMVNENVNLSHTSMPRDFVIINRLQWGMFSILADIEAEFNAYKIMHELVYS